jgi:hypothetical protein
MTKNQEASEMTPKNTIKAEQNSDGSWTYTDGKKWIVRKEALTLRKIRKLLERLP